MHPIDEFGRPGAALMSGGLVVYFVCIWLRFWINSRREEAQDRKHQRALVTLRRIYEK